MKCGRALVTDQAETKKERPAGEGRARRHRELGSTGIFWREEIQNPDSRAKNKAKVGLTAPSTWLRRNINSHRMFSAMWPGEQYKTSRFAGRFLVAQTLKHIMLRIPLKISIQ